MMNKDIVEEVYNKTKPNLDIAPVTTGPVEAPFAVKRNKDGKVLCYTKTCEDAMTIKSAMDAQARLASLMMAALMDHGEKQEPKETPQDTGTTTGTAEAPAAN